MLTGKLNGIPAKVLLSNRQYAALRLFTDERPSFVMDTDNALLVDQRSFGSLFHRGYIRYEKSRGGFTLTNLGKRARQAFGDRHRHVTYFFSVTVIAGNSCGLSVCFVNSPTGSCVELDRT